MAVTQLDLGPQPIILEKPKEKSYKHMKGLYLKGLIDGKPVNRMLVDTGAAVNPMSYSVLRRLGRSAADLIKTNVMLNDFNGQPSEAQGVLNVELTVGHKTIPTSFFIVNSKNDSSEVSLADMNAWDTEGQEPISGSVLEDCDRIKATKNGLRLVLSTGLTE